MGIVSRETTNNAHKCILATTFQQNQAGSKTDFFRLIITR
jgi:hypothetical protein